MTEEQFFNDNICDSIKCLMTAQGVLTGGTYTKITNKLTQKLIVLCDYYCDQNTNGNQERSQEIDDIMVEKGIDSCLLKKIKLINNFAVILQNIDSEKYKKIKDKLYKEMLVHNVLEQKHAAGGGSLQISAEIYENMSTKDRSLIYVKKIKRTLEMIEEDCDQHIA